jgi:hypothetical protein
MIYGSENTRRSITAPWPRDADFRNGSRWEGERENTPVKQHQNKTYTTKAQKDVPKQHLSRE